MPTGGDWGGPEARCTPARQAWIASPAWALVHALATLDRTRRGDRGWPASTAGRGPGEGDRRLLAELAAGFDPGRAPARGQTRPASGLPGAGRAARGAAVPADHEHRRARGRLRRPRRQDDHPAAGPRPVLDVRLVGGDPEAAAARHPRPPGGRRLRPCRRQPAGRLPVGQGAARDTAPGGHARLLPGAGPVRPALPAGPVVRPLLRVRPHPRPALGVGRGRATRPAPTVPTSTPPWPGWRSTSSARPPSCSPTRTCPRRTDEPGAGGGRRGRPLERGRTVGYALADLIRGRSSSTGATWSAGGSARASCRSCWPRTWPRPSGSCPTWSSWSRDGRGVRGVVLGAVLRQRLRGAGARAGGPQRPLPRPGHRRGWDRRAVGAVLDGDDLRARVHAARATTSSGWPGTSAMSRWWWSCPTTGRRWSPRPWPAACRRSG